MTLTLTTARFNKAQYVLAWRRQHHSMEQQAYPVFKNALDAQVANVSDYIKRHGVSDLSSHITVLITPSIMADAYLRVYKKVGVAHAGWTYNNISLIAHRNEAKSNPIQFFSERWNKLMSLFYNTQAGDRIAGVNETTRDSVRQLLDESQDMTVSEQATYLTDKLDDPDFNRMRALRIARTETTTATNYGALLGGESSDYEVGKMWMAVLDANTRPDHADASGQTVAIGEYFEVGSSMMQYPGDMTAPAAEVINCRCSIAVVPILDERGLPMLKML